MSNTPPGGSSLPLLLLISKREDWPAKRKPWIDKVRALVADANRDGGRALVLPARTMGAGPAPRLLEGLDFELGEGFAPHPLFTE